MYLLITMFLFIPVPFGSTLFVGDFPHNEVSVFDQKHSTEDIIFMELVTPNRLPLLSSTRKLNIIT